MTRLIAGVAGGRRLTVPPGLATRPTTDRVREALFSSLGELTGLRVLDLFAGSGALGLEALSRGAASATMVEQAPAALRALRRNVAELGLAGAAVRAQSVQAYLREAAERFDLVLADPPYTAPLGPLLAAVAGVVGDRLVLERSTVGVLPALPDGLRLERERRYGQTTLCYLRAL